MPSPWANTGLPGAFREKSSDMPAGGIAVAQCTRMAPLKVAKVLYYEFFSIPVSNR